MNVEGMWAAYFGDADGAQINSGIAVLETERIFGGDSLMAYHGHYSMGGGVLKGELRIWANNPHIEVQTAFGNTGTPEGSIVQLEGLVDLAAGEITGQLWEKANPDLKIPAYLRKVAELP